MAIVTLLRRDGWGVIPVQQRIKTFISLGNKVIYSFHMAGPGNVKLSEALDHMEKYKSEMRKTY